MQGGQSLGAALGTLEGTKLGELLGTEEGAVDGMEEGAELFIMAIPSKRWLCMDTPSPTEEPRARVSSSERRRPFLQMHTGQSEGDADGTLLGASEGLKLGTELGAADGIDDGALDFIAIPSLR